MAKLNLNSTNQKEKGMQPTPPSGKGDRILFLFRSGIQDINSLANTFSTINSALGSRKSTDTENAVKMSKAETDAQKEAHRHEEELAKIEQEWKKISNDAFDREQKLAFIKAQISRFQAEYDKYMNLDTKEFLSDTVTSRLDSLRKTIMELTKELNRS